MTETPAAILCPLGTPVQADLLKALRPLTGTPVIVRRDNAAGDEYVRPSAAADDALAVTLAPSDILSPAGVERLRQLVFHDVPALGLDELTTDSHLFFGRYVYASSSGPELTLDMMELRNELLAILGQEPLASPRNSMGRPGAIRSTASWVVAMALLPFILADRKNNRFSKQLPVWYLQWPLFDATSRLVDGQTQGTSRGGPEPILPLLAGEPIEYVDQVTEHLQKPLDDAVRGLGLHDIRAETDTIAAWFGSHVHNSRGRVLVSANDPSLVQDQVKRRVPELEHRFYGVQVAPG